jgi:hypothetical protein
LGRGGGRWARCRERLSCPGGNGAVDVVSIGLSVRHHIIVTRVG